MMATDGAVMETQPLSAGYSNDSMEDSMSQNSTQLSETHNKKEKVHETDEPDSIKSSEGDSKGSGSELNTVNEQDSSEDEEKLVIHENSERAEDDEKRKSEESSQESGMKRKSELELDASNPQKKTKTSEDHEIECSLAQDIENDIKTIRKEIQNIAIALRQKEEEWNDLLITKKKKEVFYTQLMRKKTISLISSGGVTLSSRSEFSNDSDQTKQISFQSDISVVGTRTPKPEPTSNSPQISISVENQDCANSQLMSKSPTKSFTKGPNSPPADQDSTGFGPQGPTVSVHQLIAAHRKENPNLPPIRGAKRGAWKSRYEGERKENSSPAENESLLDFGSKKLYANNFPDNHSLYNDPNVSYKDMLLKFAQMTQQVNGIVAPTPQISIIPMTKNSSTGKSEPMVESSLTVNHHINPDRSSALAKLLMESQASNNGTSKGEKKDDTASQYLTLSALLSSKDPAPSPKEFLPSAGSPNQDHNDNRKKKTSENVNPQCQGCHNQKAQFVCAGCGNQWYCSRSCQVQAWDKHADHCHS